MGFLKLVMIVRDCQDVICDTLKAAKPYIDEWTILDTGSQDNTRSLIQEILKDIPGSLFQEPFVDFSTSRNRALDLAGISCEYIIMLDDSYVLHGGNLLRNFLKEDCYEIAIQDNRNNLYYSKRVFRACSNFRYKYRVHEVLETFETKVSVINYFHDKIYLYDKKDWKADLRSEQRQNYYLKILTEDYAANSQDSRVVYFLANTHYNMKSYKKAIEFYEKRIALSNSNTFSEEVYMSYYMLGNIYEILLKENKAIYNYEKSYSIDSRAEPLFKLSSIHYKNGQYEQAYGFLSTAYSLDIPEYRTLQIEYKTYTEEIPFLYLDVCMKIGFKEKISPILRKLFKVIKQDHEKFPLLKNILCQLDMNQERLSFPKILQPCIVIHIGTSWTTGGSEYMAYNLGKIFARLGYKVVIFVKSADLHDETVQFLDTSTYLDFMENHAVKLLIVSRFSDNLFYSRNTENMILWLHYILPNGSTFYTHKEKFKGVVCLTEWHAKFFCKEYNFPENLVHVIGNAVDASRFDKKIEKVPYRFIYSSNAKRGLDKLVNIFDFVKQKYPSSSLYIFTNLCDVPNSTFSKIKANSSIFIHERVSQEQLALEFLKSDIWLYPTDWKETFCITALEAQISRVLCCTYKLAGLAETIGPRGILANPKDEQGLFKKLFYVMDTLEVKNLLLNKGEKWAKSQTFENMAEKFLKIL